MPHQSDRLVQICLFHDHIDCYIENIAMFSIIVKFDHISNMSIMTKPIPPIIYTARLIIPAFFFRRKGYINFVPKSVRPPSVHADVRPFGCADVRPSCFL